MWLHVCVQAWVHQCMHACMHTCTHTRNTYTDTFTRTRAHTHTRTHTHTHTFLLFHICLHFSFVSIVVIYIYIYIMSGGRVHKHIYTHICKRTGTFVHMQSYGHIKCASAPAGAGFVAVQDFFVFARGPRCTAKRSEPVEFYHCRYYCYPFICIIISRTRTTWVLFIEWQFVSPVVITYKIAAGITTSMCSNPTANRHIAQPFQIYQYFAGGVVKFEE